MISYLMIQSYYNGYSVNLQYPFNIFVIFYLLKQDKSFALRAAARIHRRIFLLEREISKDPFAIILCCGCRQTSGRRSQA